MKSPLFETRTRERIEDNVRDLINSADDFLSIHSAGSTRAAGDAIQSIVEGGFLKVLGDLIEEYSPSSTRREMADIAFRDKFNRYRMDVKTHRENTAFSRPNLTSVERLANFYEDDSNFFIVLMVKYDVTGTKVKVRKVYFVPIEHLKWDCLTIGALGTGQIQLVNSKRIEIVPKQRRRDWMLELCDQVLEFYSKESSKIPKRISKFERRRKFWHDKRGD